MLLFASLCFLLLLLPSASALALNHTIAVTLTLIRAITLFHTTAVTLTHRCYHSHSPLLSLSLWSLLFQSRKMGLCQSCGCEARACTSRGANTAGAHWLLSGRPARSRMMQLCSSSKRRRCNKLQSKLCKSKPTSFVPTGAISVLLILHKIRLFIQGQPQENI